MKIFLNNNFIKLNFQFIIFIVINFYKIFNIIFHKIKFILYLLVFLVFNWVNYFAIYFF